MTGPVKGNLPTGAQEDFAGKLRALMHEQRLSVTALAALTGISQRLIRRYRSTGPSSSRPVDFFGDPTPNAYALAKALRVPVTDLVPVPDPDDDLERAA